MLMCYHEKSDCCGCAACANICPKKLINMVPDEEGFLYPEIVDNSVCIDCGLCVSVCPIKHSEEINSEFSKAFAGWCKDCDNIESASGGAAFAISDKVISDGGIVYGVRYADDCKSALYTRCVNRDDIVRTRSSKYIQARKNDVYRLVKADLVKGENVLFIGLPCEVYAVKRYVGDLSERLLTVSLICHGPTSEKVHAAFCDAIEARMHSTIASINVRYKKNGHWKPYYILADTANGREYIKKFQSTEYDMAFQCFKRPSCQKCRFKNNKFCADILIGDFHSAQKGTSEYNFGGVSSILPLSSRGESFLNEFSSSFVLFAVDLDRSLSQKAIHSSVAFDIDRRGFVEQLEQYGLRSACHNRDICAHRRAIKKKRTINLVKSVGYNVLSRLHLV